MDEEDTVQYLDAEGFTVPLMSVRQTVFIPAFMKHPYEKQMDDIRNLEVRDDDVFLCACPKSGTHWLWEVTHMLLCGRPEYSSSWKNAYNLHISGKGDLDALPSPRVFNSHLKFHQLPKGIQKQKTKLIFIKRNIKDVAVSYFCQLKGQEFFNLKWEDYLNLTLEGKVPFGSPFDYLLDWERTMQEHPDLPVCCMEYERMTKDPVKEVKRLAQFLGTSTSNELCEQIAEACSFKNLKKACEELKDQKYHIKWKEGTSGYFRKGQVGNWKDFFTVAQSELFDKIYAEKMGRSFQEF